MDERTETTYLKQYVQLHPDNRMAWYLLGKEYMLQGKEAKANYCFLRAGDVYEAFERKKHPLHDIPPQQALEEWNRSRYWRSLLKRSAVLALLLFGLTVVAPGSPNPAVVPKPSADRQASVSNMPASEQPAVRIEPVIASGLGVLFIDRAGAVPLGEALAGLLYGETRPAYGMAVRLAGEGNWRWWDSYRDGLLLSVEREQARGEAAVRMHDADSCACEPVSPGDSEAKLDAWTAEREQLWVLRSAIRQYRDIHGGWPASIGDLTRPYPDNLLAGDTPFMAAMFPEALEAESGGDASSDGEDEQPDEVAAEGRTSLNAGIPDGLPDAPLEIIVDTANHRLALVSGGVILRNYPVGLGGDKTPAGEFRITEKVKNPNGRDDGDFGSRGMTLSDTLYAIHGTNEPESIGKDESLGCVRMAKADIEELYDMVPIGTKVTITEGVLPDTVSAPEQRFRLEAKSDETNPGKVYRWL